MNGNTVWHQEHLKGVRDFALECAVTALEAICNGREDFWKAAGEPREESYSAQSFASAAAGKLGLAYDDICMACDKVTGPHTSCTDGAHVQRLIEKTGEGLRLLYELLDAVECKERTRRLMRPEGGAA